MRRITVTRWAIGAAILAVAPLLFVVYHREEHRAIVRLRDSGATVKFSRNPDSSDLYRALYGAIGYPALRVRSVTLNQQSLKLAIQEKTFEKARVSNSLILKNVVCESDDLVQLLKSIQVESLAFVECANLPPLSVDALGVTKLRFTGCEFKGSFSDTLGSISRLERLEVSFCTCPATGNLADIEAKTLVLREMGTEHISWFLKSVRGVETLCIENGQKDLSISKTVAYHNATLCTLVVDWTISEEEKADLRDANPSIEIIETPAHAKTATLVESAN